MGIRIYGVETIDTLSWPDNEWARDVRKIIVPFIIEGSESFINNVKATMQVLLIDDIPLPIALCEPSADNSYVCSTYAHYVTYALEAVDTIKNRLLKHLVKGCIKIFGAFLSSCGIDKTIYVNNWLLPTNLYPELSSGQIDRIIQFLAKNYPEHAIVFRSINPITTKNLFHYFQNSNVSLVLSRIIYFTDTAEPKAFKSRMIKSDLKLLEHTSYAFLDDEETLKQETPRIQDLYTFLNIKKYSPCNPQFNEDFVRLVLITGWMRFFAFQKESAIDGVCGYFYSGHVINSPFYGYDLSKPQEEGLYRLISIQLLLEATDKKMILHQSSGAGHYKKLRHAEECPEYLAVYQQHLGFKRRFCWKLLEILMTTIGIRIMRKF